MAGSRRFKIGDIFTRTSGLLQSGVLKAEDKPLWYDVYEAFPPVEPPRYNRPKPYTIVKPIFYPEDVIRAKYYQKYGCRDTLNLNESFQSKRVGFCQAFVEAYQKIEEKEAQLGEEEIMVKAERELECRGIYLDVSRRPAKKEQHEEEDLEETNPVPIGNLEVPDPLMKSGHLAAMFSREPSAPQVPAYPYADDSEELTPEEQKILMKNVEELNKLPPIMDETLTDELSCDEDEEEFLESRSAITEAQKRNPPSGEQS